MIDKARIRKKLRYRRQQLGQSDRQLRSKRLVVRLTTRLKEDIASSDMSDMILAGYFAVGSECSVAGLIDIWPGPVVLPCVELGKDRLVFRAYDRNTLTDTSGTAIPQPDNTTKEYSPDIILVPLIGFTRHGDRLGQGQGWYDRTISKMQQSQRTNDSDYSCRTIGIGFACQEEADLPTEPHDQPLDLIATEDAIYDFRKGKHIEGRQV